MPGTALVFRATMTGEAPFRFPATMAIMA